MLGSTLEASKAVSAKQFLNSGKVLIVTEQPKLIVRCVFYAFVFSLPFEMARITPVGILTVSKLLGYILAALAMTQFHLCFRRPPKAFWFFVTYFLVMAVAGYLTILEQPDQYDLPGLLRTRIFSVGQMLVLFWIAFNLFSNDRTTKGALFAVAIGTLIVTILSIFGFGTEHVRNERLTTLDANPNALAAVLSIGLLAAIGLGYGRQNINFKSKLFSWLCLGFLAIFIVRTGSRGAVVALVASFMVFVLKKGGFGTKVKVAVVAILAIGLLAWASYEIAPIRERWERTFYEGDLANRQSIYEAAWIIFQDKPVFGWGPVNHYWELGARLGEVSRDPHNLYLWLLTEVGLVGAIPFFAGLLVCARAAWLARNVTQDILPLVMLTFVFIINMKGSYQNNKLFWVMLAYILATSRHALIQYLPSDRVKLQQPHYRPSRAA